MRFGQDYASNGPASLNDPRNQSPAISYAPENQAIQFHTPEKEPHETDALLDT